MVTHVFNLNLESGAQTSIPFLLHCRLYNLVDMLWIHFEIQWEWSSIVKWLFLQLGNWDTETQKNRLNSLACEETLNIRADHFNFDFAESAGNRYVKHLVDGVVKHLLFWLSKLLEPSFFLFELFDVKANYPPRLYNKWVTRHPDEECIGAC